MGNGKWRILIPEKVIEEILSLPGSYPIRVRDAIAALSIPAPANFDFIKCRPGKDRWLEGKWRLKVGDYRVFVTPDMEKRTILVNRVERRTSTTY